MQHMQIDSFALSFAFEMDTFVHGLGRLWWWSGHNFLQCLWWRFFPLDSFSSRCVERKRVCVNANALLSPILDGLHWYANIDRARSEHERKESEREVNVFFVQILFFSFFIIRESHRDGYAHDWSNASELFTTKSRRSSPRFSFRTMSSLWRKCQWMALRRSYLVRSTIDRSIDETPFFYFLLVKLVKNSFFDRFMKNIWNTSASERRNVSSREQLELNVNTVVMPNVFKLEWNSQVETSFHCPIEQNKDQFFA